MVRTKLIISILIVLAVLGSTALGKIRWTGGGGDNLWNNPANWNQNIVPPAHEQAQIDAGLGIEVLIDANHVDANEAVANEVRVAYQEGNETTLIVDGGTLRIVGRLFIAAREESKGTVVVNSGQIITPLLRTRLGEATITLNGGLVDCAGLMEIGMEQDREVEGALNANTNVIELNAGTLKVGTLTLVNNMAMDIKDGMFILGGDSQAVVEGHAQAGRITVFGQNASRGGLIVRYDPNLDQTLVTADASLIELTKAWAASPTGEGTPLNVDSLTWNPGDMTAAAQGHDVYFGTDDNAVSAATVDNPEDVYMGRQDANSFDLGELILAQTYYWRVDQIDGETGEVYPGNVWSFTIVPSLMIDNFDGYPNWEAVLEVWQEAGSAYNWISTTFAADGNALGVDIRPEDGLNGEMILERDMDLTANGIKALAFDFASDPNQGFVQDFYVELSDGVSTARVTLNDPVIVRSRAWGPVDIDLAEFVGVNLAQVKSLTLGVNLSPGNDQRVTVYFDNLLLFPQRCVPEKSLATDLNGDCVVDDEDLAILTDRWLEGTVQVTAAEGPDPNTWFTFDNLDNIAPFYNAFFNEMEDPNDPNFPIVVAQASYNVTVDPTGGYDGSGAAVFPGDDNPEVVGEGESHIDVNSAAVSSIVGNEFTISLWVYGDPAFQPFDDVVFDIDNPSYQLRFECPDYRGRVVLTHGITPRDTVTWSDAAFHDWAGEWNHYALVEDAEKGILQIYHNGLLVAENTEAFQAIPPGCDMRIGATNQPRPQRPYHGKLDDMRIYGSELPHGAILSLAGVEQLEQAPVTPADINQDGIVDQADLDLLEADKGKEQLWPE